MTSVTHIVLVMLLALGATACSPQTPPAVSGAAAGLPAYIPIPPDLDIATPAADVPKEVAAFAGRWYGSWYGERTNTFMAEQVIIVEKINLSSARVFYGGIGRWGDIRGQTWGWRLDAKVDNGILTFTLPNRSASVVTCRMNADGTLVARAEGGGGAWVGQFAKK